MDQESGTPAPRKRGGALKVLVLAVLVCAGTGGGVAWWLMGSSASASAASSEPALDARGIVVFEPFLVNLADQGGNRFLKATIQLVLESSEQAAHVEESPVVMSHLRSAILELLTQQSAPALVTPEGKDALKEAIKARTAPLLAHQKVLDVLFSEFVVQF